MKPATEMLSRLVGDRRGNFGVMAAVLLPVLLGAGGISIDVTKMMMTKTRLQDAADSAALAAASALANNGYSVEKAKLLAMQFLTSQMKEGSSLGDEVAKAKVQELVSGTSIDIREIATVGTGKT
ncbi:MAG TPA: TadE/TadG family type IV pilus assembly protein, partial [Mycoplana sp.]|nr:TadE/TadG family type IV pilus assembly protein [Mycoplana sp.]